MTAKSALTAVDDLNHKTLRLTLGSRITLSFDDDNKALTRLRPALEVEYETDISPSGRRRWKEAIPGVMMAIEGIEFDDLTYADLLEGFAQILRAQEAKQ